MRDDNNKTKLSWPKNLVRKWLNIKGKTEDFHADGPVSSSGNGVDGELRDTFSCSMKKSSAEKSRRLRPSDRLDHDPSQATDVQNFRIFVSTWNVAGKSPPTHLNLKEWLHTSPPSDIYVLGFQEIVPLNAGNVLGTEDNGPARKWLALIRRTLNSLPAGPCGSCRKPSPVPDPIIELDDDFEAGDQAPAFLHGRRSLQWLSRSMRMAENDTSMSRFNRRLSVCDGAIYGHGLDNDCNFDSDEESGVNDSDSPSAYNSPDNDKDQGRFCLIACKQMVGIFLTIWIRSELRDAVRNLKVSCVGRGLMGYLGNKGSISISMSLHQTSFCFVCSHLSSGEKEGDELRRNSDVMEILRKTRFPRVHSNSPRTILEHDRIIWLGDLNYRISLSYRCAKALVEMHDWRALLENDQLRVEQSHGRVFAGWNEGRISFPPTYKYSDNSDRYAGEIMHPKEKRRTPAWCDRILWHGRGLLQLSYVRGESRFSDHRPVYSIFVAEVESLNRNRIKKTMSYSSCRVEVEELLPPSY